MFKQKGSIVLISLLVGGILTLFGLGYYVSNEQKNINLSASSADLFKISSDNLTPVKNTWGIVVSSGEDVCITGGNCLSTGGGGTYNYTSSWEQLFTNALTPTSTTAGIFVKASSTFDSTLRVNSGLIVNSNATTTGSMTIGSLLNCDTIDTDANGLFACGSDASGGVGDWATDTEQYFWNNTTTWTAYDTNWARNANATTTQTNFTPNWNALYNATTTQAGFATQFASYYNATTTYPGFQTQFDTALNATSTLDLTSLMCTNATTTSLATTDFTVTGALNLPANGITDAMVSDTLTCSNLVAGSAVVADSEVVDALTLNTSIEGIFTGNIRTNHLNATTSIIDTLNFTRATGTNAHLTELCIGNDCKTSWPTGGVASWDDLTNKPATSTILNLLDTQNRISVLNATTTNIGTLKVYTALDFPANSITSAMMTTGWNALHNATTTYPGFQSQFNTALNATTTWAGFTPAWNTLFNATTTWSAFDTNWNRKANATTTYPGFASQFATAYNATTTQTNFTPNWNALFNATTTWAGFTSNFNTLLNATTTLDLSTFSVGSGDAFTINSSGVASSTNTTTIGSMKCYKSPNQESHTTTCIAI